MTLGQPSAGMISPRPRADDTRRPDLLAEAEPTRDAACAVERTPTEGPEDVGNPTTISERTP